LFVYPEAQVEKMMRKIFKNNKKDPRIPSRFARRNPRNLSRPALMLELSPARYVPSSATYSGDQALA